MEKYYNFFLLLLLIFIPSCKNNPVGPITEEQDLQELVFRSLFVNNDSGFVNNSTGEISHKVKVYFIEFFSEFSATNSPRGEPIDPTDEFISRFKDFKLPVKKASLSMIKYGEGIVDKFTGEIGLRFYSGPVKVINNVKVEIIAGYHYNGGSASGNRFTLEKIDGA